MRNPGRWRRTAVVLAVAGIAMAAGAPLLADRLPGEGWVAGLFACGLPLTVAALLLVHASHRAAKAQARLARGVGTLARWHVDADAWRAFEAADQRATSDNALANELSRMSKVPASGVDVIVGEDAIDIGGSIHLLPLHGAPEVLEANLHEVGPLFHLAELRLRYPPSPRTSGGMRPAFISRLAFPLPPGAWRDARPAIAHYALGRPGKASFFHGPGDGSDPEDNNTCDRCGYRTHRYLSTCPQCGAGMLSRRWARRYGALLVLIGSGLMIGLGILMVRLSPMLADPGSTSGGMRFSGTRTQALAIWLVLGAVWIFGATATAQGVYQLATGKRKTLRVLVFWSVLGLVVVLAMLLLKAGPEP